MPIQLVAFDLDDTFLMDDRTVSPEDLAACAEAQARGVVIVPASGRRLNSMEQTLRAIGHSGPVITLNGAKVVDYPSCRPLYERYVDPAICLEAAAFAKEHGTYLQFYMDTDFEYERDCEESALYAEVSGGPGHPVGDLQAYMRGEMRPSQKLLFIQRDSEKMRRLQQEANERFGGRLSIFRSKPIYLEMTHPEVTKGAALAYVCGQRGILPQWTMAIGDGENDLSMIEYAGIGVAVANAAEEIRQRADVVTADNMHGGVAAAIRKYVLIGEEG